MISNHDRSGWIGASDTAMVMGSWGTESFCRWWATKIGIRRDSFSTPAMRAGTAYEHKILDAIGVKTRDRQIRRRGLRLRVNYDGETRGCIAEVKTHQKDAFRVTRPYWMQCQVEMFASKGAFRKRKLCIIVAYRITPDELGNFYLPVDVHRLSFHRVNYDAEWINTQYLPRLKHLAKCLVSGSWPKLEDLP